MNFVIVTQDVGNGNALKIVVSALRALGHHVDAYFGEGKSMEEGALERISESLASADRLVVSYSSAEKRTLEERYAFTAAIRQGVPVAIFSDIYGMVSRSQWFGHLSPSADLLFVLTAAEVELARPYVGKKTKIVYTGNPAWAAYFDIKYTREEVRARLGVTDTLKLVFVGGSKEHDRNDELFTTSIDAMNEIDENFEIVMTLHPGADHSNDVYDGILEKSRHPVRFLGKEIGLSSQEMLPGLDLIISPQSTLDIMAACLRKPVIVRIGELDAKWWKELSGLDYWPPAALRTAVQVKKSVVALQNAIPPLLDPESTASRMLRIAQKEHFSKHLFENASATIVKRLTQ